MSVYESIAEPTGLYYSRYYETQDAQSVEKKERSVMMNESEIRVFFSATYTTN